MYISNIIFYDQHLTNAGHLPDSVMSTCTSSLNTQNKSMKRLVLSLILMGKDPQKSWDAESQWSCKGRPEPPDPQCKLLAVICHV